MKIRNVEMLVEEIKWLKLK